MVTLSEKQIAALRAVLKDADILRENWEPPAAREVLAMLTATLRVIVPPEEE